MRKAKAPDDGIHEELVRRNKERELRRAWEKLVAKHIPPKKPEGEKGLAFALRLMLALESQDPKFRRDIPEDKFPIVLEVVNSFRRRVHRALLELNRKFLRRLGDGMKLITTDEAPLPWDNLKLTVTGYALLAWAHLFGELGGRPDRKQLRERVERLRKEDGETERVSDRQWSRTLKELKPLFPGGG
jgi:hypothetical protein